jgi:NADH-quinone oxidoreductase subunit J
MLHLILFSVFGIICAGGAVNLLVQRHPINSALSLVVVMGSLAVEYLLLGAEFVAAIQVIVYAGAIMVLFVFVIMLLNAGEEERTFGSRVATLIGIPGMLAAAVMICWELVRNDQEKVALGVTPQASQAFGNSTAIARLLFHDFLLPFEVTSILVLIAILGAVVLAARPESVEKTKREA